MNANKQSFNNGCVADIMEANRREVLGSEEAARFLGITRAYLYKLTCSRQIEYYRPRGGKIYFRKSTLEAFQLRNRVATADELNDRAMKEARR